MVTAVTNLLHEVSQMSHEKKKLSQSHDHGITIEENRKFWKK